jgi:diguanylate cyclase (GGDEF)-like protein
VATLQDVVALPFIPEPSDEPNVGFSQAALWLRFSALAATGTKEWILECAYPPLDHVDVYAVRNGVLLESWKAGDSIPVEERPMPGRTYRFHLRLSTTEATTYYLRIQTEGSGRAPLQVWDSQVLGRRDLIDHILLGGYFGVLLVMVLYNLLIFLSYRDRTYLYYIGYVASHALFQAAYLGVAMVYLWPWNPWVANMTLVAGASMAALFSCLFAREFLQRGRLIPKLKFVLNAGIIISAANTCATFFLPYSVTILVSNINLLLFPAVCMLAGFITLMRGYTPARFYLMAWSVLLLAVIWLSLGGLGVVPGSGLAATALQIGSVIEVVLLSLAITDKISHFRRQAAASERELALSRERELRATTEKLYHDGLTGLPNRARLLFDEPELRSPTLFLLNVDRFKQVNDFYGNRIGDQILLELAHRIDSCPCPLPRRLYRLHADEYALVLEGEMSSEACLAHGRAVHAACTGEPYLVAEHRVRLDASVGVSRPGGPLLEHADMALAEARAGGATVGIYDPSMETMKRYANNLRWVGILRDALKADALFPLFQPIRDNASGRIGKYEGLVRLRTDDGGIVSPSSSSSPRASRVTTKSPASSRRPRRRGVGSPSTTSAPGTRASSTSSDSTWTTSSSTAHSSGISTGAARPR